MRKRVIKLIVAVLCMMAFCMPIVAYAEDVPPVDEVVTTTTTTTPSEDVGEPPVDDVLPPVEDTTPPAEGTPPTASENTDNKFSWEEVKNTFSTTVMMWIQEHLEEIGVIVTLIGYGIALFKKLKTNNKSVVTMNNNAIAISKKATDYMEKAMESIESNKSVIAEYKEKMDMLLEAYKSSEDARKKLEIELLETKEYLRVDSMANLEFANMFEELLVLANIPNYKKEEMGKRHLARVAEINKAIEHAEHITNDMVNIGEVKENVTEEA